MGKYEDEDGVDGPWDRAMASAIREDAREAKPRCERCRRVRAVRVAPTDDLAARFGDAARCGACWIALGDSEERAEALRQSGLGRCATTRDGLRCDQIEGHADAHDYRTDRAKRQARRVSPGSRQDAPRTDADALETRLRSLLAGEVEARVALAVEPLRAQIEVLMLAVSRLTDRLDARHA